MNMTNLAHAILFGLAASSGAIIFTRKNGPWGFFKFLREAIGGTFACTLCLMILLVCVEVILFLGPGALSMLPGTVPGPLRALTDLASLILIIMGASGMGLLVLGFTGTLDLDL